MKVLHSFRGISQNAQFLHSIFTQLYMSICQNLIHSNNEAVKTTFLTIVVPGSVCQKTYKVRTTNITPDCFDLASLKSISMFYIQGEGPRSNFKPQVQRKHVFSPHLKYSQKWHKKNSISSKIL